METLSLKQKLARVAEANRAAEQRRLADLLYTDEQFRRNGYGKFDSCPLPETNNVITVNLESGWRIVTNNEGHCLEFEGTRVDIVPNSAIARDRIATGAYLSLGACCELPINEADYHTQHLEAGYCFQTMPSGVVHVYDPDGNPHIATDIENADQCIRDGEWNCGQQCPVEIHMSPVDVCGNQEIVISPAFEVVMTQALYDHNGVTIPALEADEDGVVFMPAYLTEQEYRDSEALMEF